MFTDEGAEENPSREKPEEDNSINSEDTDLPNPIESSEDPTVTSKEPLSEPSEGSADQHTEL